MTEILAEPLHDINPFVNYNISSYDFLNSVGYRSICHKCLRSRRYFCYTCFIPMDTIAEKMPHLKLPLRIHIIKHPFELSGKSTAVHAKLLAPEDTNIYIYPDLPDLNGPNPKILLYPVNNAHTLEEIIEERLRESSNNNSPLSRDSLIEAIFVDGTWGQAGKILRDERLQSLTRVKLKNYKTCFWRYQRKHSNEHLATIEAIYHFVKEYQHIVDKYFDTWPPASHPQKNENNVGRGDKAHAYDNLLFFYAFMHQSIKNQYAGRKVIKAWKLQKDESSMSDSLLPI